MNNLIEKLPEIAIAFIGGGGLVALLNHINNKRNFHLNAEKTNIDTALRLRDEAVREYNTAEEKLAKARALLDEVQTELDQAKRYIDVLQDILRDNDIPYPEYDSVKGDQNNG